MSNTRTGLPITSFRIGKIFPRLTPEQLSRIAARGHIRAVEGSELLYEQGNRADLSLWLSLANLRLYDLRFLLRLLSQSMNPASLLAKSAHSPAGRVSFVFVPPSKILQLKLMGSGKEHKSRHSSKFLPTKCDSPY